MQCSGLPVGCTSQWQQRPHGHHMHVVERWKVGVEGMSTARHFTYRSFSPSNKLVEVTQACASAAGHKSCAEWSVSYLGVRARVCKLGADVYLLAGTAILCHICF